jgi:zinc protease
VVEKQVRKGIEPKSQVSIVFTGSFVNDEIHRLTLRAMGEMLSGNLHRTLREDLGGTYGVSVEPRFTKRPKEEYRIAISFACDPARAESLIKSTFDVIAEFKDSGRATDRLRIPAGADAGFRNQQPAERLPVEPPGQQVRLRRERRRGVRHTSVRRSVDADLIRDAARTYLDTRRYVEVMLLPEARK